MNGNSDMNEMYNNMNNMYDRMDTDDYRKLENGGNSYDDNEMNRMYDNLQNNMNYYMKDKECDGIMHKVQDGDTLYKISRMHNVSISDLIEANRHMNIYDISEGNIICVPFDEDDKGADLDNNMNNNVGGGLSDNLENMHGNGKWMVYIVEDGDTLDKVLALYDMNFDDFIDANKQNGVLLKPGSIVVVPDTMRRR